MFETNKQFDVYHLIADGDQKTLEAIPSISALTVYVEPAGSDILAVYPGEAAFSLYKMFVFETADLRNGDKLVGIGGETFYIKGIPQVFDTAYDYHLEVVIEKVVGT